ncbi:hypothetical protein J5X84_01235 [Streptosporangiaceae bacterium NEAU-GS5]|nr:hypothetical protein [Streptosporangiaceae bacterium NEAU-GS5]
MPVTQPPDEDLRRQVTRVRRALRERDSALVELETRLAALEESLTFQTGKLIASAVRRPGRRTLRLPRDLYRLWRRSRQSGDSGDGEPAAPQGAVAAITSTALLGVPHEERALIGDDARRGRLVIAGILTSEAVAALRPYAHVVRLSPHSTELGFELADPDVVIIQAAACGVNGPWAHLGDPSMTDRETRVRDMMVAARSRGCPVVLLMDAPAAPRLLRLPVDDLDDGDLGLPLHLYNPVGLPAHRAPGPVESRDPEVLRAHATAVAADHPSELAALACGAGIGAPLSWDEIRANLRTIFERDATPVRLAALATRLGLRADPLAGRRIAVLAPPEDDTAQTDLFAGEIQAQTLPPAEIVAPGGTPSAPWVAHWTAGWAPTYLADLACARECSQADVVGLGAADYAFAPVRVPGLVRRDLTEGSVDEWARRGARTFSMSRLGGLDRLGR